MRLLIVAMLILNGFSGCQKTDIVLPELTELNGNAIDLFDYHGKIVYVNFWATWCGPCIQEMPSIQRAQNTLKEKDVVFLFASNEDPEEIESFAQRNGFPFHFVRVHNLEELKISVLPTTYIFDEDGVLKFSEAGARDWSQQNNLDLILQLK